MITNWTFTIPNQCGPPYTNLIPQFPTVETLQKERKILQYKIKAKKAKPRASSFDSLSYWRICEGFSLVADDVDDERNRSIERERYGVFHFDQESDSSDLWFFKVWRWKRLQGLCHDQERCLCRHLLHDLCWYFSLAFSLYIHPSQDLNFRVFFSGLNLDWTRFLFLLDSCVSLWNRK